MSDTEQQQNQQIASLFSFGNKSSDVMNLTNYVDQMFNEEPVDMIPIPMITESAEDIKLDAKLNTNCDNATLIGGENLRAYAYPGDDLQEVDLEQVYNAGNMYTTEIAGWLYLKLENPTDGQFIKLRNTNNNMIDIDKYELPGANLTEVPEDAEQLQEYLTTVYTEQEQRKQEYAESKPVLLAKLPVSKYQVVEITYSGIDNVKEVDEGGNTVSITVPEALSCYIIPSGTQTNIGETLVKTRDYKDIMAGIGFPDKSKVQDITLPESGSKIYVENDCYFSIATRLTETDYFSMYTGCSGVDLVYTQYGPKIRRAILQVCGNSELTVDYKLENEPEYFIQIEPKGRAV